MQCTFRKKKYKTKINIMEKLTLLKLLRYIKENKTKINKKNHILHTKKKTKRI